MKQFAKLFAKRLFRSAGYEVSRIGDLENSAFRHHLRRLFKALDVRCVLDVGAHVGEYGTFLRDQVGYRGLIISFEPIKKSADMLATRSKHDSQWIVYDFALGGENTTKQMNVMRLDGLSSFLTPNPNAPSLFDEANTVDHAESVEVKTLDWAMKMLRERQLSDVATDGGSRIGRHGSLFLKMDTQGYDLEVIKGAANTMKEVVALQTELSVQPLYEKMPDYRAALALLEQLGFAISGLYPVVRDAQLRVVELDCVMVNRNLQGMAAG